MLLLTNLTVLLEQGKLGKEQHFYVTERLEDVYGLLDFELRDCTFTASKTLFLFGTLKDSSLKISNCRFRNVILCYNCFSLVLTLSNVTFDGMVLSRGSELRLSVSEAKFTYLADELVDCEIFVERSVFSGLAQTIHAQLGKYASSLRVVDSRVEQLASYIFSAQIEVISTAIIRCGDNIEDTLLQLKNVTFLGTYAIGILDVESIFIIEDTYIGGVQLVYFVIGTSSVLIKNCTHFDCDQTIPYFGTLSDSSEVHFLDFAARNVNVYAGALIASNISGMQALTFQYTFFENINAVNLVADEIHNLRNLTVFQSTILEVPHFSRVAESFFVYILESRIVYYALNSSLICYLCENGALYIFHTKAILSARYRYSGGSLMRNTFSVYLQLKESRFGISEFMYGLSTDLIGHLLIESCYFDIKHAVDGLVSEIYADGIIFDSILIVTAENAILFGQKLTSVPFYVYDLQLFDSTLSGCKTHTPPVSRLQLMADEFVCGSCEDIPDWFYGFDYDYSRKLKFKVYSDDTLRWAFQYCYYPLKFASIGKFIIEPNEYAEFLYSDELDYYFYKIV